MVIAPLLKSGARKGLQVRILHPPHLTASTRCVLSNSYMPQETEHRAMEIAIQYEKKEGRKPRDVSSTGCGYDIESGNRLIEVKGFYNERYPVISLYKKLKKQLGKNIKRYYVYVVYDIDNDPKLKIIKPKEVEKHLEVDTRYIIRGRHYRNIKPVRLRKKMGE